MPEDNSEREEAIKKLASGGAILVAGTFLSKAIMYFYRLLVAQQLGPGDYGLLNLGLAVFWIGVSLSSTGIGAGIERKISDYIGKGKEERISAVIFGALSAYIPISLVLAVTMFFGAGLLENYVFHEEGIANIIRIFALAVPFQILYTSFDSVAKAFRKMRYVVYVDRIFRSVFTVGVTGLLLFFGYGILGAVVAQLGAIILSSILIIYFTQKRVYPIFDNKVEAFSEERRKLISYSWPLFMSGIVGLVMNWTDTLLLGIMQTAETVGVYQAAFPTAQLLTVVSGGIGRALFPTVSEYYGKEKKDEAIEIASTSIKWIFSSTFPALLLMVAFAEPILRFLFGKGYTGGAMALSILGTAFFIRTMTSHSGKFIQSEDRTKISMYNSLGAAGLNVILNLILIPLYSQTGAALATAFSTSLIALVAVLEIYYLFDIQAYNFGDLLPSFISALISAAIVHTALNLVFDTVPFIALVPGLLAFTTLYGALFIAFGGLSEDDMIILREIDQKTNLDLDPLKKILRVLTR